MILRLLLTTILQWIVIFAFTQKDSKLTAKLDSVLLKGNKPGWPGCACLVTDNGNIIYEKAFGLADVRQKIPINLETIMGIGSVSKQFTAYALLLLEKQGKLSLNDPVTKYIELPYLDDTIRLHHLLTHTSGFHECTNMFDILYGDPERMRTMKKIEEFIKNHRTLEFIPGTQYNYNNTGYSLAAFIIERVSGEPFKEYLKRNIFQPLKMKSTNVIINHDSSFAGLAIPYKMNSVDKILIDSLKHNFYGLTGLFTSVTDLVKWDGHLAELDQLNDSLYTKLTAPNYLKNGKPIHYGFGLEIGTYLGHKVIAHSGRDNGYTSYYLRFPQRKLSFITLCNNRYFLPWDLSYRMADVLLPTSGEKENIPANQKMNDSISFQLKNLVNYTGLFWSPQKRFERDAVIRIELRDNDLFLVFAGRSRQLIPVSTKKLLPENSGEQWLLKFDEKQSIDRIVVLSNGDSSAVYYKVKPFSDETAGPVAGTYRSDELGISVTIRKDSERWILDHPEMGPLNLLPVFERGFNSKMGILVWEVGNNDRFRLLYEDISHLYFHRIQ